MITREALLTALSRIRIQAGSVSYWVEQGDTQAQAMAALRVLNSQIEALRKSAEGEIMGLLHEPRYDESIACDERRDESIEIALAESEENDRAIEAELAEAEREAARLEAESARIAFEVEQLAQRYPGLVKAPRNGVNHSEIASK